MLPNAKKVKSTFKEERYVKKGSATDFYVLFSGFLEFVGNILTNYPTLFIPTIVMIISIGQRNLKYPKIT